MKDKKKGFQQSAIVTESLETFDFRPFGAYYLSLRDIKTTVSHASFSGTCPPEPLFEAHSRFRIKP